MNELFNWTNTGILWSHNLPWLLLALGLGAWIGFTTCEPVNDPPGN